MEKHVVNKACFRMTKIYMLDCAHVYVYRMSWFANAIMCVYVYSSACTYIFLFHVMF